MKQTILIGGKAGQGINKISEIITSVLCEHGYHVFNYRDYPSLIRGGHNFNLLTFSNEPVFSNDSKIDYLIAMDEDTIKFHKKELRNQRNIISFEKFSSLGRDSNIAQASALLKIIGATKEDLLKEIKKQFKHEGAVNAVEQGFESEQEKFKLEKLGKKTMNMIGNIGIVRGALSAELNSYIAYPMTPATGVLHEIVSYPQVQFFQSESEVAAINQAIGCSFAGKKTMVGTSGGGFDLMTEGLSFAGMSEIPLTIYLASRPGPGTGIPTYTSQADLNLALYSGHGEFPRVVICPGSPEESEEKTSEAICIAEKFKVPTIVLSDKHLAESGFSIIEKPKTKRVKLSRKVPGKGVVKASSYEHDRYGNTIESAKLAKLNAENRLKKLESIRRFIKNLTPHKIYGEKNSQKLIISFGSTKGVILDVLREKKPNAKFLQIIYVHPLSDKTKQEILKHSSKDIFVIETNSTSQLADLIRKETGIEIPSKNKILRYDGRPFFADELGAVLERRLK